MHLANNRYVLKLMIIVKLSGWSGSWVGELMSGIVGGWVVNLQAVRWVGG